MFSVSAFRDRSITFRIDMKCVLSQDGRFVSTQEASGRARIPLLHCPSPCVLPPLSDTELCPGTKEGPQHGNVLQSVAHRFRIETDGEVLGKKYEF